MRNRILQRLEDKKKKKFQMGGSHTMPDGTVHPGATHEEYMAMMGQGQMQQYEGGGMYNQMRQYQMGGQQLPGGIVEPIPGSDAVEFSGATHDQGGIMMDSQTEVEDGETMDQVTMAKKGGKRDYFFSNYLKKGGKTFADQHKEVLAMGGTQEDIDTLAKMQEHAAGRKVNKVAKLGGVIQYQEGGATPDYTKISTQTVPSTEFYDPEEYKDIASKQGYKRYTLANGKKIKLYGDEHLFEQIKSKGVDSWLKDMYNNADPAVMEAAGITSYDQMGDRKSNLAYQKAWNAANPDNPIKEDKLLGEQTTRTMYKAEVPVDEETEPCPDPGCPEGQTWNATTCACEGGDVEEKKTVVDKERKKDYSGTMLGLAGMIPAVMAFKDKPDYMDQPDLMAPGIVKAERVAKQHLDRVDFNDQLARNSADATAVNRAIDTSGGGPASIANKMAMYAKKQQGDREIQAQEERANIAIANEEAGMDTRRKVANAQAALDASKYNVQTQADASKTNIRSKMYVDEFNRGADAATKDRKLNAVQYGINTLATLHKDKMMGRASADFSAAIDGQRGALERFWDTRYGKTETESETETETTTPAKRGGYRTMNLIRNYGK